MATFKMTIAEGTPLWNAIGGLSSKARNAEIYRLATMGLFAQNLSPYAVPPVVDNALTQAQGSRTPEKVFIEDEMNEPQSSFMTVDLASDLKFLVGN